MLLRRFHISCAKDATCGATACDAVEVVLSVLPASEITDLIAYLKTLN